MDIVSIAGEADSNVEYEMIQDGTTSIITNDEIQTMDYSSGHADENEQIYEVTMEEFSQEQESVNEPHLMEEGGEIEDTATMEDERIEELEINDEDTDLGEQIDGGDVAESDYVDNLDTTVEEVVREENGVARSASPDFQHGEGQEAYQGHQAEAQPEEEEITAERVEEVINATDAAVGKNTEDLVEGKSKTEAETIVKGDDAEGGKVEGEGEEAYSNDAVQEREEAEEIHAPPAVRVTFNGQDFVLFPHLETSTYISAQQEDPIAAPKLSADPSLFYESLDSLFEAFRIKDCLGDFLEEGTELEVNFVDLELILREDDIYAREVSLNDIHRLHLGFGLTSSLHLIVSEVSRFITRYNELAAHASSIFDQAAEQKGYASHEEVPEAQNEEPVGQVAEKEEKVEVPEKYDEEESTEGVEPVKGAQVGEEDGEEQVPHELYNEEALGQDDDTKEGAESEEAHKFAQSEATHFTEEAIVPHQNHEETIEEGNAEDVEAEGDDIVDYDEAYQSDEVKEANGDADETQYDEEEEEEASQEQTYEAEKGDLNRQQKRPLEDDTEGQDHDKEAMSENEGKRVKVDG